MFHPSIRIEPCGDIKVCDLVALTEVQASKEFNTQEEKTAYIEGLLLGTSSFIPFVKGISSYTIFENNIALEEKWIIGSKRFNVLKDYFLNDYRLGTCRFIPALSDKTFEELHRGIKNRLKDIRVPLFSIEWTGRETDYKDIGNMIAQQFGGFN